MGSGNSSGGGDSVNQRDKTGRLGNNRDGMTDTGRSARDRDPDGNFGFNDHTWSSLNGNGCSSCHSSDPGQFSQGGYSPFDGGR